MSHDIIHAINSAADHTGFGDSVTKNVGVGAGDIALGDHAHADIHYIGDTIPPCSPLYFGADMARAVTADYYSVLRSDVDATIGAAFHITQAGTYSLRIIHAVDGAAGDVAGHLNAGATANAEAWATATNNIYADHDLTLGNAVQDTLYQTDHDLGALTAGDFVLASFTKTGNDGAGTFIVFGMELVRTA